MYTEDEAKGKWCPEARVVTGKIEGDNIRLDAMTTTYNRIKVPGDEPLGVQGATCIGSDCMEWRWSENDKGESKIKRTAPDKSCPTCTGRGDGCDDCDHTGFIGEFTPLGYCGLGGAPRG